MLKRLPILLAAWLIGCVRENRKKEDDYEKVIGSLTGECTTFVGYMKTTTVVRLLMAYISQCDDGEDDNGNKEASYTPHWRRDEPFWKIYNFYKTWLIAEGMFEEHTFTKRIQGCLSSALTLMRSVVK